MSDDFDLPALTAVLDALLHPMALSGPDAQPVFLNTALRRYHGLSATESPGEARTRVIHPDDVPQFAQAVHHLLAHPGLPHEVEVRLLRADGQWRWHISRAEPISLRDGSQMWVVSFIDIDEHRRQEQRLLAEQQRADAALALIDAAQAQAPMGFAFVDREFRFQRINAALAEINGVSVEEHLGRRVGDVVPGLWPQLRPIYSRALDGATVRDVEVEGETVASPGVRREFLATYFPVQVHPDEPVAGVGVIVSEITEKRQLERQLHQAQRMEAVGHLAGGIAHDFNNVLAVVTLTAQTLLHRCEDDEVREGLERILAAARSATDFTRALLVVARREPVDPRPVHIAAAVDALGEVIAGSIPESIELVFHVSEGTPPVLVDPTSLDQVLLNLVVNARDAMPEGGRLTISAGRTEGDPGMVTVMVADTGVGMTREVLEQATTPFFTTKFAGLGTGLGLSTVYGIVTAAGGTLDISSQPGSGTAVTLHLPEARVVEASPSGEQDTPSFGHGQRILVVEDEPALRASIAEVLRMAGYVVCTAADADEARAHLVDAPDLLLSDVVLRGTPGPELAREVEASFPTTRILLMSGYTGNVLAAHGGTERWPVLGKPFTMSQLLQALADHLDGDGSG